MFEKTPDYEAAYIGEFPCQDALLPLALEWALERASRHGCGITVVVSTTRNFSDGNMARLPASIGRMTWRNLQRPQPVVIAAWADSRALDKLDELPGVKAVLLMPWVEEESLVWRQAR